MITEQWIQDTYAEELERCLQIRNSSYWAHGPRLTCKVVKMRALGTAGPSNGVQISTTYVGTGLYADCRDTIRHELAHMYAGVSAKHGPAWRTAARMFGATPRARSKGGAELLEAAARNAKYSLWACLETGARELVGGRQRRDRNLVNYAPNPHHVYKLAGVRIERFEYIEN